MDNNKCIAICMEHQKNMYAPNKEGRKCLMMSEFVLHKVSYVVTALEIFCDSRGETNK